MPLQVNNQAIKTMTMNNSSKHVPWLDWKDAELPRRMQECFGIKKGAVFL
jgi:hypothetical protein